MSFYVLEGLLSSDHILVLSMSLMNQFRLDLSLSIGMLQKVHASQVEIIVSRRDVEPRILLWLRVRLVRDNHLTLWLLLVALAR